MKNRFDSYSSSYHPSSPSYSSRTSGLSSSFRSGSYEPLSGSTSRLSSFRNTNSNVSQPSRSNYMSSSFTSTLPRSSTGYGSRSSLSGIDKSSVSASMSSPRFSSSTVPRKTYSLSGMSKSMTEAKSSPVSSSSFHLNSQPSNTYGSVPYLQRETSRNTTISRINPTSDYSSTLSLRDANKEIRRDSSAIRPTGARDFTTSRSVGSRQFSSTNAISKDVFPSKETAAKDNSTLIMGRSLSQLDKTFKSINNPPSLTQSMTSYPNTSTNDIFVHKAQPKLRVSFADLRSDDKIYRRDQRDERVSPSRHYHNRGSEDNLTSILKDTKLGHKAADRQKSPEVNKNEIIDRIEGKLKNSVLQWSDEGKTYGRSTTFDTPRKDSGELSCTINHYKSSLERTKPSSRGSQEERSDVDTGTTQSLRSSYVSEYNSVKDKNNGSTNTSTTFENDRKSYLQNLKSRLLSYDDNGKRNYTERLNGNESLQTKSGPSSRSVDDTNIDVKREDRYLTRVFINPASSMERTSKIFPSDHIVHVKRTVNEPKKIHKPVSKTPVIDSVPSVPIQIPKSTSSGPSPLQKILRLADFDQKNFQKSVKIAEEKKRKEQEEKIRREKAEEMRKTREKEERQRERVEIMGKRNEEEEAHRKKDEFLEKKKQELMMRHDGGRQIINDIKLPPPDPSIITNYTCKTKNETTMSSASPPNSRSSSTESGKSTKVEDVKSCVQKSDHKGSKSVTSQGNNIGEERFSMRESSDDNTSNPEPVSLKNKIIMSEEFSSKLNNILNLQMQKSYHGAETEKHQLPRLGSLPPPILLITSPSAPSSPISPIPQPFDLFKMSTEVTDEECSGESEYEYEEYDEWETEDDDDEEEDGQTNATITIGLWNSNIDPNTLHPKDARKLRSTSPEDFDFTLPPVEKKEPQRRMSTLPPPPIFTASVTCDGTNWEKDESEVSDEDYYASATSRMENPSSLGVYLTPEPYSSDGEYVGNMDVGCVLTLVDRAAMADSEECSDESDYTYEDEEIWTEEEYSGEETNDVSEEEEIDPTFVVPLPFVNLKTIGEPTVIKEDKPAIKLTDVQLPDKSSIRKAPENMTPEEQERVEKEKKDMERQNRSSNRINTMKERFKEASPPKEEKITYKRSSRLELKDEIRPKKTYKVIKPVINDEFDKQMAELREQMKNGETKLRGEFKDLSQGINTRQHDLNLKLKEEKHKEVIEKASESFKSAEDQKQKWIQQFQTGTEKKTERNTVLPKSEEVEIEQETRRYTKRIRKVKTDESEKVTVPDPAEPMTDKRSELSVAQKKILLENKNENTAVITPSKDRRKSIPTSRRKTRELINLVDEDENGNKVVKAKRTKKRRHLIPKNRFTRKPFDIDDFLGLSAYSKDFDKMDEHFCMDVSIFRKLDLDKKRKIGPQKVWISQLTDIDKLYRPVEIRDIKLDAFT